MLCISGINNLFNSISGYFTLPEGYEFGDLIGSRDSFFSADNSGNFESFTGYVCQSLEPHWPNLTFQGASLSGAVSPCMILFITCIK